MCSIMYGSTSWKVFVCLSLRVCVCVCVCVEGDMPCGSGNGLANSYGKATPILLSVVDTFFFLALALFGATCFAYSNRAGDRWRVSLCLQKSGLCSQLAQVASIFLTSRLERFNYFVGMRAQ